MNKLASFNFKKKVLIVGGPYKEKSQEKKTGGISRSIDNLIKSHFFQREFEYELFDDSNYSTSFFTTLISSFSSMVSLQRILKERNYDIVLLYCNSISLAFFQKFIVSLIIKISGNNLVVRYGGSSSIHFFSITTLTFFFNLFFSMQSGIIVQGAAAKSFYKKFKNKNIFTGANFVLDREISEVRDEKHSSESIEILLVAGLDYIRKGFRISLDAMSLLKQNNTFKFKVIGCNLLVKKEIRKKGLERKLELFGNLTYSELEEVLTNSHILILPSYSEGLPNLILEAMAKGLVVITTRVGSIPDVICDGKNGYFVNVGDIGHLSEIIDFLNQNKSKIVEISNNNIIKIRDKYSEKVVVPDMVDFLLRI